MLSFGCNYYCICKSVWKRWCSVVFYLQRKEERAGSRTYHEYLVFDGLLQCGYLNDDWLTICPAAFDFIWSLRECLGLCISVYDDLSDWNTAIYGCSRNESFYQCSGIFNNRNVFGCNWSNCKFTT